MPFCIYCGRVEPTTTVDHIPPTATFDHRAKPRGLEVPSCLACNNGTRVSDLVAALFCRTYPDAQGEAAAQELQTFLREVSQRVPGLLEEMRVPRAKEKFAAQRLGNPDGGFLSWEGPIVTAHLNVFAAKLAFAFHFHATGTPVPKGGGVVTTVKTNVDAWDGKIPEEIFSILGPPRALVQGTFDTQNQFKYAMASASDANMSMGFASFRKSFCVTTFGSDELSRLRVDGELPTTVFQPGDLRTPVPTPEFWSLSFNWKISPPNKD